MFRQTAQAFTLMLSLAAGCKQERLSLPIAHAAPATQQQLASVMTPAKTPELITDCYEYILRRPPEQRAMAVQARLKQADQMSAALDSRTFTVDLVGDHANILLLQFPIVGQAPPVYTERVSSVIDDYFAAAEVQDYLCNSGFQEVRLFARDRRSHRPHPVWTARVTMEGLIKLPE